MMTAIELKTLDSYFHVNQTLDQKTPVPIVELPVAEVLSRASRCTRLNSDDHLKPAEAFWLVLALKSCLRNAATSRRATITPHFETHFPTGWAHALFSSFGFAILASRFARFVSSQNAPPIENTDALTEAATTAQSVLVMLTRRPLCQPGAAACQDLALR
jgi:hypothetical protein